ncbi:MAG: polysaccharide deacetylase family protein [Anaerolineaceae bacterium]|nr:polysaccharide deacetylase family protein [Anaerolineaceae bacterium]
MKKPFNPILKQLGFSENDRVVIIHTDDIGMCQATIDAYEDLDAVQIISSGAIIVPCPWFLATVRYAQEHPETDLGIHLTLNSEWETYRWSPLSTRDPITGLIDSQGYFHRKHEDPQEFATVKSVEIELKAQIQQALDVGFKPTHVDTHMLTLLHPKFLRIYLNTAYQFGLPAMIPRWNALDWQKCGFDPEASSEMATIIKEFEELGYPMLDHFTGLKLYDHTNRIAQTKRALADLPPGLSHFYIHPSKDTPEARAISPDWQARVADYEVFMDERMRDFLKNEGIQVIGYRPIQKMMPE